MKVKDHEKSKLIKLHMTLCNQTALLSYILTHYLGIKNKQEKLEHIEDNAFIFKKKDKNTKEKKKSWEPFQIYQLTSTANPDQFDKLWLDWL